MLSRHKLSNATRVHWLAAGLVLLATCLAYLPGLNGSLLFDDLPNLSSNQLLQIDGATLDDWRVASFSSGAGLLRRPVSMFTFAANYSAAGEFSPFALKAVNLAIHLLIGVLVYCLVRMLARAPALPPWPADRLRYMALASAAIWLLHPLHVSTVLYAVQRMAQLSTLFVVIGLIVYVHYRQQWVGRQAKAGELVAAALWLLLLTGAASFSKENGVLLPWLVLVVEVALYGGYWGGTHSKRLAATAWLLLLFPLLFMALLFLLQPGFFTAGYLSRSFDLEERLLTQGRMLWHYVSWILVPNIRAMGFQHDDIMMSAGLMRPLTTLLALVGWVALLLVAALYRRRFPLLLFAVVFYLVAHFLESGLFALEMVYEHRNYLPSIGICVLLGAMISNPQIWRIEQGPRYALGVVLGILVVLLLTRSYIWSDSVLMARSNVENHPDSPRARFFYGDALVAYHAQRDELGLTEHESRDLMVTARQHFVRMYELAPEDLASLVMLYSIDAQYFPVLAKQMDWLGALQISLETRVLQASDIASLSALVKSVIESGRDEDAVVVMGLLDRLMTRRSIRNKLSLNQYNYLLVSGAPLGERLAVLDSKLQLSPGNFAAQYYRALEYSQVGQVASSYESVKDWMVRDRSRRHLSLMKSMFLTQEK